MKKIKVDLLECEPLEFFGYNDESGCYSARVKNKDGKEFIALSTSNRGPWRQRPEKKEYIDATKEPVAAAEY